MVDSTEDGAAVLSDDVVAIDTATGDSVFLLCVKYQPTATRAIGSNAISDFFNTLL